MHDWLFQTQQTWQGANDAAAQFRTQALSLGADGAAYDACLADPKSQAAIDKDFADGKKLGVRGTPQFFLYRLDASGNVVANRQLTSGALPFQLFAQALDEMLNTK